MAMNLETLYALVDQGDKEDVLDYIIRGVDALLCAGKFEELDRVLADADVTRLSAPALVGLLNATLCVKDRLPARSAFLRRLEPRLVEIRGPTVTARLLARH